jgi:hypothetical protein
MSARIEFIDVSAIFQASLNFRKAELIRVLA